MEASMHGTYERSGKTGKPVELSPGIRLLVIPALLAVAVVALAIRQPDVSRWISDAAQAEFASTGQAPAATQVAQPVREVRAVKAD